MNIEKELVEGWEDVFKKGQLTLWIMLALKDGPKHMAQVKDFIFKATNGNLSADDQSMYRALRRYYEVEMVEYGTEPGESGPDRKVYRLTGLGLRVLNTFVKRNITEVFFKPELKELFK